MEFPYVTLMIVEDSNRSYDMDQLMAREEFVGQAKIAEDMGDTSPVMAELTQDEQMALMLAWGNDELAVYAKSEDIELPVPLATMFSGEYAYAEELQHLRTSVEEDVQLFAALEEFATSHPLLVKSYIYENENDNVDLITSAKAITLQPGKHLSDVMAQFEVWFTTPSK